MEEYMETKQEFLNGFEECFSELEDSRQISKIFYPLIEVVFLSVVAVAGGAFSWSMIESFGKSHLGVLQEYYPFKRGAPSDDTIRRVFEIINPKNLNKVLMRYFGNALESKEKHIAIDGKTLKGSKRAENKALHMLNVYASKSGVTLFSKKVSDKTNEITAIPEALDLLDIAGSVVTIDAIACQKNIAKKILDKKADYILQLKKNQISLYNEVEAAFATNAETFFNMSKEAMQDKGHGRSCLRTCRTISDLNKFSKVKTWSGLKSVIEIQSETTIKGKTTFSKNYYISSADLKPKIFLQYIRNHWKIESMHWMLDVVFREDNSSLYKGNIPANMAIIRRFILNILSRIKEKRQSRPLLMKLIGWNQKYLYRFINALTFCS